MITAGLALVVIGVIALLIGVFVSAAKVLLWVGIGLAVVGLVLVLVNQSRRTRL